MKIMKELRLSHVLHSFCVYEVYEGVAQVGVPSEVAGQVDEVVHACKAVVQQGQQHVAGVVVGQVTSKKPLSSDFKQLPKNVFKVSA